MVSDDPRWLDQLAAAHHLSLPTDVFRQRVKAGALPPPSTRLGTRSPRWDRAALDAAMEGGLTSGGASHRESIHAIAAKIAQEGGKGRAANARGRNGKDLPIPT